jgi:hypothetical protein
MFCANSNTHQHNGVWYAGHYQGDGCLYHNQGRHHYRP